MPGLFYLNLNLLFSVAVCLVVAGALIVVACAAYFAAAALTAASVAAADVEAVAVGAFQVDAFAAVVDAFHVAQVVAPDDSHSAACC